MVSVPADQTAVSTLTIEDFGQGADSYAVNVVAFDGNITSTLSVTIDVKLPSDAAYKSGYSAPAYILESSFCDSGTLLDGRGNVGPEANQPNSLDTCTNGPRAPTTVMSLSTNWS